MMKIDKLKQMAMVSLFWGALWGIAEATIGYLAHLVFILPGIAGFIMFPIGFYFMSRAYKETGKPSILLSTASVAAVIKMADLFLPALSPFKTINPALCILLEAAVVIGVIQVFKVKPLEFRWSQALIISSGWRLGYIFYSVVLAILSISNEFIMMGFDHIFRFLVLESLVNALVITLYLQTSKSFIGKKEKQSSPLRLSYALVAVIAAVVIKVTLAIL